MIPHVVSHWPMLCFDAIMSDIFASTKLCTICSSHRIHHIFHGYKILRFGCIFVFDKKFWNFNVATAPTIQSVRYFINFLQNAKIAKFNPYEIYCVWGILLQ